MNLETRNKRAIELYDECLAVQKAKGADYSGREDALANFKRNAERLGMTKYQIWAVYTAKHIDSIFNSIKTDPNSPQVESEPLRGRIVDAISYLSILEALLAEDREELSSTMEFHKEHDLGA
jgi:hypothetical protein